MKEKYKKLLIAMCKYIYSAKMTVFHTLYTAGDGASSKQYTIEYIFPFTGETTRQSTDCQISCVLERKAQAKLLI